MKRALPFLLMLVAGAARAEDSVTVWGNYYKERSTRVYEPMIKVAKDLPYEASIEATYLVDQITSASGAFTGSGEDRAFQEYRNEVRVAARKRFLGLLTPGASFRVSYEPDYTSFTYGADLELSLFGESTTLRAYGQYQTDDVRERVGFPQPRVTTPRRCVAPCKPELNTTLLGVGVTQLLRRDALAGLSFEAQILRGFQENPYRPNEAYPSARNRFAMSIWGAYQFTPSRTTARVTYRFYWDDWDLSSHAVESEITQRIFQELEVAARFRLYTQSAVYFATLNESAFISSDPKLDAFASRLYGVNLRYTLSFLRGGPLETFQGSRIEPSYALLDQDTSYGIAHIAQLGWYWPF